MKKRLIIANWKMYVETPDKAMAFARTLRTKMRSLPTIDVSLAPSFILIPPVAAALAKSSIKVGAQSLSANHNGAHTGETSARQLKAAGATFSLVGHSERRRLGESNELVRKQILEATEAGLGVVLCVGESERDQAGEYFTFIKEQLASALINLPKKAVSKLIVAYEPVWAIGKHADDAMKPQDIQEAVIFIKKTLTGLIEPELVRRVPILYGGSVEEENAPAILKDGGVSGFLVGHASANIENFVALLKACK